MTSNKHFDTLKNKLPENWTNENATHYYNRAFWNRAKCEYGNDNPSKLTADKWNPVATESTKWTRGCNKNDDYYKKPRNYHYSYNNETTTCEETTCEKKCNECFGCYPKNDHCNKKIKVYNSKGCGGCNDCNDVAIIYRFVNEEVDCDNIVELRVPVGGSKEKYLAKYFSSEFIDAHKFVCAEAPVYNIMPNNLIDNQRQYEFTDSDQTALIKRGIRNELYAKQLVDEGKLINNTSFGQINAKQTSYYFNENKQYKTGLNPKDLVKAYFM